jgi:hypothetical protein
MEDIVEGIDALIAASSTVSDLFRNLDSDKEVCVELPSVAARRDRSFVPPFPERLLCALVPLPGKAWAVYLILWRQHRLSHSKTVTLTSAALRRFGLTRHEKAHALSALEAAGLITVQRQIKKNPQVTLRTVDELFPFQEPTP